jgi:hypothetical protein
LGVYGLDDMLAGKVAMRSLIKFLRYFDKIEEII